VFGKKDSDGNVQRVIHMSGKDKEKPLRELQEAEKLGLGDVLYILIQRQT